MSGYNRGGRRGAEELPQVDWGEVFRQPLPDLRRPIFTGVVLVLFWILFSATPRLYTDYRWFQEVGFDSIFTTEIATRLTLFAAATGAFFLFYVVNIFIARRLTPRVNDESSRFAQIAAFAGKSVTFLLIAGGFVLALFVGLIAQAEWLALLRFQNATPFNVADPIFHRDVSFYVFTLPVYEFLIAWLGGALILTVIAVGITYALGLGQLRWTSAVKAHLSALSAGVLLLSAWNYQVEIAQLVYSPRGVVIGASYTDVNAEMPGLNILTYIALGLAALLIINIFVRALRAITLAVALWIVAWILLVQVYPAFVQNFEVRPSEFTKEQPYLKFNIDNTRMAYGLDSIQDQPFPAEEAPTPNDIAKNADTVANIRLSDYRPLLQTYNQIQSIRTYYDFLDVDVDRYTIDGKYRQVMISARELATQKLAQQAQTWVNLRLLYTHGYGAVTSPVNEFTPDGLPKLLTKDIPPSGVIPITRPEIYFGEEQSSYVFVKTREKEFDYPKGDENVFSVYAGSGGVSVASFFDRAMFALRFGDVNVLLADSFMPETRVLFNRNLQTRLTRIAPFLMLDRDPYPVLGDGKIYWIQDAYTRTNRFPYSERYDAATNYIRNSVKIVIDAYNGTTIFYAIEPDEPILKTYSKIFPALVRPFDQMPASLRDHLRYPEGLFSIQAALYRTYHMQDPQVFYNREDLWAVPNEAIEGQSQAMEPYYVIMRLPGESKEEFMLMLPFVAARRQNMVAWMSVKADGADYGKKLVYRFPKDKLVYGPEQIHARLNQDPVISSELTLLSQRGSRVVWGNLLVIPIEKSLLYVQPLYLLAEQGQIPQLKRIVVATANSITMQASLGEALAQIFAGAPALATPTTPTPPSTLPTTTSVATLVRDAVIHYNKAQDALKTADWTTYGNEMKLLQQILLQLEQAIGQSK
ncbi:MAG: UPF0182 family protein [Chloroflexi bacterium]|nr:UPF0182 family protein [Chloroflexota bacterium]